MINNDDDDDNDNNNNNDNNITKYSKNNKSIRRYNTSTI